MKKILFSLMMIPCLNSVVHAMDTHQSTQEDELPPRASTAKRIHDDISSATKEMDDPAVEGETPRKQAKLNEILPGSSLSKEKLSASALVGDMEEEIRVLSKETDISKLEKLSTPVAQENTTIPSVPLPMDERLRASSSVELTQKKPTEKGKSKIAENKEEESLYDISYTSKDLDEPFSATVSSQHKSLTIKVKRFSYDGSFSNNNLIALFNNMYRLFDRKPNLFIPKLYAALEKFTGHQDEEYDSFKGNFSFKFLLNVNKKGQKSQYIYCLYQVRSLIDVSLFRIDLNANTGPFKVLTKTDDNLFSDQDINEFTDRFFSHFVNEAEAISYIPKPFILRVQSNFLVSGYISGYFHEEYNDESEFNNKIKEYQNLIKSTEDKQDESSSEEDEKSQEQ